MEVRRFHTSHAATLMRLTVEGRMVVRVDNTVNVAAFGQQLQSGARTPGTLAEAARARFVVAFPVTERKPPHYIPTPSYPWALRQGFDWPTNLPMTPDVYMTWPGMQEDHYIPSGWNVVCFEGGTYTVNSGQWVYDPLIVPGVELEVNYNVGAGTDGMLQILASGTAVALCREVNDCFELTFDLYHK